MNSTDRTPAVLSALSIICFALSAVVVRMVPESDAWFAGGLLTGLGIGLILVALRQYLKGRRRAP